MEGGGWRWEGGRWGAGRLIKSYGVVGPQDFVCGATEKGKGKEKKKREKKKDTSSGEGDQGPSEVMCRESKEGSGKERWADGENKRERREGRQVKAVSST